jgi:hypothetical protein
MSNVVRGKLSDQQRASAARGMSSEIAGVSRLSANGAPSPGDDRLDSKRRDLAALVSKGKDISNSAYHYTQKMRDEGFAGDFAPPSVLVDTLKLLDETDELRIKNVIEKRVLQHFLLQGPQSSGGFASSSSSSYSPSPSSPIDGMEGVTLLPRVEAEEHERKLHQKRFALKKQRMQVQIASDRLLALDQEVASLEAHLAALSKEDEEEKPGEGSTANRSTGEALLASDPSASIAAAAPLEKEVSLEDVFNEALLEAAGRFFLDSAALSSAHRLKMLRNVAELCGHCTNSSGGASKKDLTLFEMLGNQLGDQLAALASYIMRDSKTVRNISLGNTHMTGSGCAQLALALDYPGVARLQGIFLGGNCIHGSYAVLILQALLESKHLDRNHAMTVDFSGNPLFRSPAEAALFMRVVSELKAARPNISVDFAPP